MCDSYYFWVLILAPWALMPIVGWMIANRSKQILKRNSELELVLADQLGAAALKRGEKEPSAGEAEMITSEEYAKRAVDNIFRYDGAWHKRQQPYEVQDFGDIIVVANPREMLDLDLPFISFDGIAGRGRRGLCGRAAVEEIKKLVCGDEYPYVFIFGEIAYGKTDFLEAIGAALQEHRRGGEDQAPSLICRGSEDAKIDFLKKEYININAGTKPSPIIIEADSSRENTHDFEAVLTTRGHEGEIVALNDSPVASITVRLSKGNLAVKYEVSIKEYSGFKIVDIPHEGYLESRLLCLDKEGKVVMANSAKGEPVWM